MVCTFFGHRMIEKNIEQILRAVLIDLIKNKNVDIFYIGNQGEFDNIVRKVLKELKNEYPHIVYSVVIAYMPSKKSLSDYRDYTDTIYPDGLEKVPPKYAILRRNEWMLKKSDYVVTYVNSIIGGAAYFKELAEKKGKYVINIGKL